MAEPIELPDCAQKLLAFLYPTVNWTRVTFYSGLPYWVSSDTVGVTIPDPLGLSGYRVYLGALTDFCDDATLSQLVHEAYHVQQFTALGWGYGVGLFRPGFIKYMACFFASADFHGNAYDNNPFEIAAYAQEAAFDKCNTVKVCDCSTGKPVFDPHALEHLKACNELLIVDKPRIPDCGNWWSFSLSLLLAIVVVAILAVVGFIGHLVDLLDCKYLRVKTRQCVEWGTSVQRECAEWADHGYYACNQWADEGYSTCTQWADHGYSTCSQWADQGYNACCTWRPCSWFCKVLVWISSWVCVATVWIASWVCLAWVWVASWVCKAFYWIANMVCLLWTLVTQLICLIWFLFWRLVLFCWLR